jgi:hypothetical protein
MFNASTGEDQLDKSHLRDIDSHEAEMNGWRAFNDVKDRLTARNKKSVFPDPRQ